MTQLYCPVCNQDNKNPLADVCTCTGQLTPTPLRMRPAAPVVLVAKLVSQKRCVCGGDHDSVNEDGSVCGNLMEGGIINVPKSTQDAAAASPVAP